MKISEITALTENTPPTPQEILDATREFHKNLVLQGKAPKWSPDELRVTTSRILQNTSFRNNLQNAMTQAYSELNLEHEKKQDQQQQQQQKQQKQQQTPAKAAPTEKKTQASATVQQAAQTTRAAKTALGRAWQRGQQIADKYTGGVQRKNR